MSDNIEDLKLINLLCAAMRKIGNAPEQEVQRMSTALAIQLRDKVVLAAGYRRSTVTPEQVEAAAKDLSGLVNRVQLWDKFEEDDRRYWRAKVQIVARWFGLSVAEDGAS